MYKQKNLEKILGYFILAVVVWGVLSFIEVQCHMWDNGHDYNKLNMFWLLSTKASTEMATHEKLKGESKVEKEPIVISLASTKDKDVTACLKWMKTKTGKWCVEYCNKEKVNPYIITSIIFNESRFCPSLVGSSGDVGLMQVLPRYADRYMKRANVNNLYSEKGNIKTGIEIYKEWQKGRTTYNALACYNGGYPGPKKSTSRNYASKVLDLSAKLEMTIEQN